MSLDLIEMETRRFLSTTTPEVLCIKGHWGVGKTFGWKRFLKEASKDESLALDRYSYVSLFGLNSLEDLRFSIFENTTSGSRIGSSADDVSFGELVGKGSDLSRKLRPWIELGATIFNRKGVADLIAKSAFLAVRNQLICLDDLERAGKGLGVIDVLGLTSFLKEERGCKVVLLLNDKEHDEREEFEKQLEKVADVTLLFSLTSDEATNIALTGEDQATIMVKPLIISLGIINIRVIKKIERLAKNLLVLIEGIDNSIAEKAIATLVLASWSVQQPAEAPPLEFLKKYNRIAVAMRAGREEPDANTARYRAQINHYPFSGPEDLDLLIMAGAEAGYFQDSAIRQEAAKLQQQLTSNSGDHEFNRVWEQLYHGSLTTDDDAFLDALYDSAKKEAGAISQLNINSAVRMLREFDRPHQADELISSYVNANAVRGHQFFDLKRQHFLSDEEADGGLRSAFDAKWREFVDARDPLEVLKTIGDRRSWGDADTALMARQSADDFERMFETLRGESLRLAIEMIRAIGNGQGEGAAAIGSASSEALQRIARKSPIRARKLARFGVEIDATPNAASG